MSGRYTRREVEVGPSKASDRELQLLGIADFAARLGISVWTARAWAYSGKIASCKVGASLKVPISELERIISEGMRPRVEESAQAVEAR